MAVAGLFAYSLGAYSLGAASLCTAAHALERVTLRSGFSYDCARREAVDPTHTRLYLSGPDGKEAGYIDLASAQITAVEPLPDLPPQAVLAAVAPASFDVKDLLLHAGAEHNIDVDLLASIVKTESAGQVKATSRKGARGLMQIMPSTAKELGVHDLERPDQNIAGGTAYLDALLTRYKDSLALALAAYNAGPGAVDRYHGVPPFRETRAYVTRVMSEFRRRKEALARVARATVANTQLGSR